MTTTIILLIIFDVIALLAMFIIFYKVAKKESKPNVFLDRKNYGCYQPNVDLTTNPPCSDKRFLKSDQEIIKDILDKNINDFRRLGKYVNGIDLIYKYEQAIEQENYELAGKLHKQIEALKNESSAHNN